MGNRNRGRHVRACATTTPRQYLYRPLESAVRLQLKAGRSQGTTVTILSGQDMQNQPTTIVFRFD
jgi:hypothetical protein